MDDHYIITVEDDKHQRKYNVHKFVKKALLYAGIFLGTIFFIGFGAILYLSLSIDDIEKNRESLKNAYNLLAQESELLVQRHNKLKKNYNQTQEDLQKKREHLANLMTTLGEIENMMGIVPDENLTIDQRINLTKISSEQRATMLQFIPNGSPILYKRITSSYGNRIHPITHKKEYHKGIDLKADINTPIYATADGIVEWASLHRKSGYGKLIIIQHNYGFKSVFGHLNKIVVHTREFVKKGDLIGYSGNTGLSSGPHLHYELRYFYQTLNPLPFMKWNRKGYNEIFKKVHNVPWSAVIKATSNVHIVKPTKTVLRSKEQEKQHQQKVGKK